MLPTSAKPALWFALGILSGAAFIFASLLFFGTSTSDQSTPSPVPQPVCVPETRRCPDGTEVGRSGPNCDFLPCPISLSPPSDEGTMCTMDARLCPDGSAVGRSGPNCEFAPCSGESGALPVLPLPAVPREWKTYVGESVGVRFSYEPSMAVYEATPGELRLTQWGPTQRGETELYDGIVLSFRRSPLDAGTLEALARSRMTEFQAVGEITQPLTPRSLGGRPGLEFSGSALGDFTLIFLPLDAATALEISILAPDPTGAGFARTVVTILGTLEFL
jgi:hypothetical protein